MDTPEQKPNGWSRYEYAVLDKLAGIEDFMADSRAFMLEVRTTLNFHADHPQRLVALEARTSEQDTKMGLLIWKVGVIAATGGAIFSGVVHFLFSSTPLGKILGLG